MPPLYDKKAVKILFDTYWTSKGWRPVYSTPPDDLAYAISQGVMFPLLLCPHDEMVHRVRQVASRITPAQVGKAFLCSLSSRQPVLRSALSSYAIARYMPEHVSVSSMNHSTCDICRSFSQSATASPIDLNVLNFERLKWGGVRHSKLEYQAFDLEQFLLLPEFEPTAEDVAIFQRILATVPTLPGSANVSVLEKSLTGVFAASKAERRHAIEAFCYAGILGYPGYGHLLDDSVPPTDRPYRDSDWALPAMYWRASDGVNLDRVIEYFPQVPFP